MAQRKKRESGSGTITKRKDGRWEARYTSGINPATGKPIRHCIYGKTQKAVAAKLREVTRDIDTGSYIEPAQYTVAEWMQTYLAEYTMNLKPYALHSYEAVIRNHITPALGKIKLQALNTVQIQAFVNSLCRPVCNGGKALSPKTAKNVYGVLHRGLDLAVRIGLLRCNPASSCILPKVPKPEIKTITDEQLDRFLAACRPDPFYRLYLVDLFTGMRQGETVVLLSKGEIDSKKVRVEFSLEDMDMSGFQNYATYSQIKERVLQQTGLKVSSLYIAQIKQKHGIIERENYNKPKSENTRQPKCPLEKEAAITEALKYFGMI